ncbi:hypothetical protein HU200_056043 [Digitaria exilis]|uniref:NB-ARC domain-containing protein n=1 Tax=Digitaria exilis TaxID=1010633 RepID=A0A835E123_9POAL|nr:hypothetical protein HU200_056043 [Digitaria exilis]
MVTTAIQSVANACSSLNGHVYKMGTLDEEHSRRLFFREASLDYYEPAAEPVLKKCGGLPLALGTTAQLLQSKRQLTSKGCADLCRRLGEHVEKEETLARMKHVLLHNYISLPGQVLKACLLYFAIFPNGHPVKRKCLIRRWLAEGFLEADCRRSALDVAIDNFEDLMNRSIIQPIDMCNNTVVKTCQTHGMMLEFIQHRSICDNFITLLYGQAHLPEKIRRLSIHRNSKIKVRTSSSVVDLSLVRSLTVFGKADKHVLKFRKYELLRVLDLEECEALNDEYVKKICNLVLLRYLSLGGHITKLPRGISKLKFLETLDVRRTKTESLPLPIEVIKLPCLLHLFGVFTFPDAVQQMSKLCTFLSEKSNMETLAGVLAGNSLAFPEVISHMNSLKKLKVRCQSTGGNNDFTHLSRSIQEFIQRGTDVNDARSLSLDFEEGSQDFLEFPLKDDPCYISSLKLQGKLRSLPPFVTKLSSITELCLSSSNEIGNEILAALSNVFSLHCLKLIASQVDKFVIEQGALRSLRHLCIVVGSITCLENKEGALPHLESLWLLCKGLNGLCGTRIQWLTRLKDISLDDEVSDNTRKEWNEAAKNHPKGPRVSLQKVSKLADRMQIGGEPGEICEIPVASTSQAADSQMRDIIKDPESSPPLYERPPGKLASLSRKANEFFSGKRKANDLSSNKRKANESTSTDISCAANGYLNMTRKMRGGRSW